MTALGVTLTNGESLTYTQALDANVSGLTDGQTYYAIVNSTTPGVIQLASTPTQAEAANPAIQDASPTLAWNNNGTAQTLSISQIEVSENTATNTPWNTLEFTSDPAIPDGTPVTYTEVPGKPIGGLTNGDTYYAYNETNPNFDSTDPIYLLVLKTTPSSSAAPVTLSQWQTLTDSSGNIYNILGSDALHDTVNIVAQDGSVPTLTTGTALTFTDSFGLSIGGLISGQTYYAIIAPSQPNSGSLLLALDNNQQDASAASPQDVASLQQTVPLGTLNQAYMSGTQQTLQPLDSAGLTITSTLTSGDTLSIGSQVGGTPTFGQMLTQANLAFSPSAWSNFVNSNWKESSAQANAVAPQGAPGWSLASAAAYLQVTNTCLVEIGSSAVLTSTGSITIGSTVTENAQPQISTSISKSTASNAASTNVAIGVGVLLAFYTTDNQAVIDSNARVDAGGALSVNATTTYPWAFQILNTKAIANYGSGLGHDSGNNLLGGISTFTNGALGLNTLLTNSWVDVGIQGQNIGTAAAVSFSWSEFTNTTLAQIADGAQINQNTLLHSASQTVSVTASTAFIQVGFAGLVYLALYPVSLVKMALNGGGGSRLANFNNNNLVQVQSKTASLGGSVDYVSLDNTTQAFIGGSAPTNTTADTSPSGPTHINYGNNASDGTAGLNVNATEDALYLDIAQGGGDSQGVAVAGTLSLPQITTTTTAQIEAGAVVSSNADTTGDVDVTANDTLGLISLAGALLISGNKEAGVSSSVNTVTRNVSALIGDPPGQSPSGSSTFKVGGAIDVSATADGVIVAAGLAAAVNTSTAPAGQAAGNAANLPAGSWGWGFSGDFTWVKLTDNVTAAVNDSGTFSSGGLFSITSQDNTQVGSGSGAVTFQKGSTTSSSVGLAGSAAVITVGGTIQAVLANAQLTQVDGLSISALRNDNMYSAAAGGSGSYISGAAPAAGASTGSVTQVAGSVAVNEFNNTSTLAQVDAARATLSGASSVEAQDTSEVVGVAGSIVLGGKNGFGLGASANEINTTTSATVTDSAIKQTAGTFTLQGTSSTTVVSVAAGLVVTRPVGEKTTDVDLSGMVAVNDIQSDTTATIIGGSYTNTSTASADGLTLLAQNTPILITVTGGLSVGSQIGVGAAFSTNQLGGTNTASLDSTTVSLSGGGISISSSSGSPPDGVPSDLSADLPDGNDHAIDAVAVGVAGSKNLTLAGSVTLNTITATNTATIDDGSSVMAVGPISVEAADGSDIGAGAGTITWATKDTSSSVGAAEVTNKITNTNQASIDTATVTSQTGGVTVVATEKAKSIGVAVGASFASQAALGGSVVVNETTNKTTAWINQATVTSKGTSLVNAQDTTSVDSSGGAVEAGGTAAIGAAALGNTITNTVTAYVASSTVKAGDGDVQVLASSTPNIFALAVGGGGSSTVEVNGSIAVNKVTLTTTAYITGTASNLISAFGTVAASALENLSVDSATGSVGGAGTAAVGIANSDVITNDSTSAYVGSGIQVVGLGNGTAYPAYNGTMDAQGNLQTESVYGVSVTADSFQNVINVAVGAQGAGSAAVAGSATGESLDETTLAYLDAGASINQPSTSTSSPDTNQGVNVHAASTTKILGLGGSVVGAGGAGIGAGVDVEKITKQTQAYVEDASGSPLAALIDAQGDIRFRAESTETVRSVSASAGGAGGVAVAGSVSSVNENLTTTATIGQYTQATAQGNVQVSANDQNKVFILAGTLTGAGTVAISASVGVPIITQKTTSSIAADAIVNALAKGDTLQANTGGFSLNYEPATFAASAVSTTNNTINLGYTDGLSTGDAVVYNNGGGSSIGGLTSGSTYYAIVVDSQTIELATTLANAQAGIAIPLTSTGGAGQSIIPFGAATPQIDSSITGASTVTSPTLISANTASVQGVVVTADSGDQISQWVISGSGSGAVAVPLSASVMVLTGTTKAFIDSGAEVNQQTGAGSGQSVYVAAGTVLSYVGVSGAAGISGVVGFGAGADVPVVSLTTEAYINQGATVSAADDVVVAAHAQESLTSVAVGAGLSGTVGVGGSVSVITQNDTTLAWIGSSNANVSSPGTTTVNAGNNVLVNASDDTTIFTVEIGVGVGLAAVGVGASVPVVAITKDTEAFVSNGAQVTGLANGSDTMNVLDNSTPSDSFSTTQAQGVAVQATSTEKVNTTTAAGGGGLVGFAGAVAVVDIKSTTKAFINDAVVNGGTGSAGANQSVDVGADNYTYLHNLVPAAVSVGGVGVAGAVNVGYVNNLTQAYLGNGASVNAKKDVDVYALSNQDFNSFALSIGAARWGWRPRWRCTRSALLWTPRHSPRWRGRTERRPARRSAPRLNRPATAPR